MASKAKLSQDQVRSFTECFNLYDLDHDGLIDCSELGEVVRAPDMMPTNQRVSELIKEVVRSSTFNKDKLCDVMAVLIAERGFTEEDIREAFKVFDREGNSFVSAAEIRHVMTNLGEKLTDAEIDEMFQAVDIEPDGQIDFEEFVKVMRPRGK